MTLRNIWEFLVRWRLALIPGLVLALAGGGAAFYYTPYTYTVSASYLLLSPVKDATTGASGNPFLQLGNGVSVTVDVLSVSLMDGETVRKYTAHAPDLTYTAERVTSVAAPLLELSVQDTNLKVAKSTLDSLGALLGERLDALQQQAGAPEGQWVTLKNLTHDPKPVLGFSDPVRNGVLAFLAVALLILAFVGLADRRRTRREGRDAAPDTRGGPRFDADAEDLDDLPVAVPVPRRTPEPAGVKNVGVAFTRSEPASGTSA
jgi:hypothetical protein